MLDRTRFLQEMQTFSGNLFRDVRNNKDLIVKAWALVLAQEAELAAEIARRHMHCALPLWSENPGLRIKIGSDLQEYAVLGVDGSQIYPDRHRGGLNCFMINIGSVLLSYGLDVSTVELASMPRLFAEGVEHELRDDEESMTNDIVDLKREELEFSEGFKLAQAYQVTMMNQKPLVCCFDGSFIFWHLEGKPQEVKERFLSIYLHALKDFFTNNILVASYISMPRNRELTNLIAMAQCATFRRMGRICSAQASCNCVLLREVVDSDIIALFLQPGERTTVFTSTSYVTREYPADLVPCFFFINVGVEIVRVEIPTWMMQVEGAIDTVAKVLLDQAIKGSGYPVVLAEAHEQAVIKGNEHDFFYEVLAQRAAAQGVVLSQSQKSLKKKTMSI